MKKKILVVDCNAKIGGIQKALIALLKQIHDVYDVTLLLLNREGVLLKEIPQDVRVLETRSDFRFMGMAQCDCKNGRDRIRRGAYVLLCRLCGRKVAVDFAARSLRCEPCEEYDAAIAYSHMDGDRSFFGGCAEYVLRAVKAKKKFCYMHCDYLNSGNCSAYGNEVYAQFDAIICVSQSTRKRFLEVLPQLRERTYAVPNSVDAINIDQLAHQNTVEYDHDYVNLLSVARLTQEKGIARMVQILSQLNVKRVRYYVVGDGMERARIEAMIEELGLKETVLLYGEDNNPYRYMLNADLLVVPSYHEAAPVVFQEACVLQLPVLTTRTLSADEMVGTERGFVVENDDDALKAALCNLITHPEQIKCKKNEMTKPVSSDESRVLSLMDIIE